MGEIHARHHSSTMDRQTIWKESREGEGIVHVDYNELLPLLLLQLLAGIPHPVSAVTQLPRAPSNPSPSNERAPTYLPTIYQPTYLLFTIYHSTYQAISVFFHTKMYGFQIRANWSLENSHLQKCKASTIITLEDFNNQHLRRNCHRNKSVQFDT